MILEWDNSWQLATPEGTLPINQQVYRPSDGAELGFYLLDGAKCRAGAAPRITRDNIAQADGEIIHRKFKTGQVLELTAQLWQNNEMPACGGVLREMGDLLDLHLTAIQNVDGQIQWTPTPFPGDGSLQDRQFVQLRALGPSGQGASGFVSVDAEKDESAPLTTVTFAFLTPIPYSMGTDEHNDDITGGGTVTNIGNTDYYPVMKVFGPTDSFAVINESVVDQAGNPLIVSYDAALPGGQSIPGGAYAYIDFFRNTIYLNGDPANNLKAGINVPFTDFWPLAPGSNTISVSGAYSGSQIIMQWFDAWA